MPKIMTNEIGYFYLYALAWISFNQFDSDLEIRIRWPRIVMIDFASSSWEYDVRTRSIR